MLIYKILNEEENNFFFAKGYTRGSLADNRDGFIHLSAKYQLFETINKHFNHIKTLYINSFFSESLGANLKWEISRNGEYFPHYYSYLSLNCTIYSLKIEI